MDELIWFLILFCLTVYFYKLLYTGDIYYFMHPKMIIYIYFSIFVMALMTVNQMYNIFSVKINKHVKWGYILFVFLLFVAFVIRPKGLNADAIANKGINIFQGKAITKYKDTGAGSIAEEYLLEDGIVTRNLNDNNYLEVMNDIYGNINRNIGKRVSVIGFVYKDNTLKNNEFAAARMLVSCCAADAEIIGFICRTSQSNTLKQNSWVRVTGYIEDTYITQENTANKRVPVINVDSLEYIKEPVNIYIYQ